VAIGHVLEQAQVFVSRIDFFLFVVGVIKSSIDLFAPTGEN